MSKFTTLSPKDVIYCVAFRPNYMISDICKKEKKKEKNRNWNFSN